MEFIYILIAVTIIIILPFAVSGIRRASSSEPNDYSEDFSDYSDAYDVTSSTTESTHATVLSVIPKIVHGGSDLHPNHGIILLVTFDTAEQRSITLPIPAEEFGDIKPGDTGTLVTVGGKYFAFGDGEDIDRAADQFETYKETDL